jgi:hypothetical protein
MDSETNKQVFHCIQVKYKGKQIINFLMVFFGNDHSHTHTLINTSTGEINVRGDLKLGI